MSPRSKHRHERGVALMMVVISLAILSVVAIEFSYNSTVDLRIATNARDELRAHFLARSGIGLSRLLLRFQRQVDQIQLPNLSGLLSGLLPTPGGGAAPSAGPAAPQPSSLSLQLWRMAKVDCYMLQSMIPEPGKSRSSSPERSSKRSDFDDEFPDLAQQQAQRQFGGFEGCFNVELSDEEERINLAKLDAPSLTASALLVQALSTFGDKKYEFLYEKEDGNKIKTTATDIVVAIRDWIDEDQTQSQLNLTGVGDPFQKAFSDENYLYSRYSPRYEAKNARFDSLDELYLVHGINDRFMAAFKEKLTVYPDLNSRLNINTDDPIMMAVAVRSVADPLRPDPRLNDPIFMDTIIRLIRVARVMSVFGISISDFVNIVESTGVAVNQSIKNNPANQRYVGDKSTTYRIKSIGEAGDVTKSITAVVRLNEGLGTLVHWKEE